jgi:hypothetical protein
MIYLAPYFALGGNIASYAFPFIISYLENPSKFYHYASSK